MALDFKTRPAYSKGVGIVIRLLQRFPSDYDEKMAFNNGKGLKLDANVVEVLGEPVGLEKPPKKGDLINIILREGDDATKIHADIVLTKEPLRFLIEGVTWDEHGVARGRWLRGAGANREISQLEIVGPPSIRFENPVSKFPKWLRLNLDGSPTSFDEIVDGAYVHHPLPFDEGLKLLKQAMSAKKNFRICQRVIEPSASVLVSNQQEFEQIMSSLRQSNYTSNVVRTFVPHTQDPNKVDIQYLSWPKDIPANQDHEAKVFDMPLLRDTTRFTYLSENEPDAVMEILPGYELEMIGNSDDHSKSTKHKFIQDILDSGLSATKMNLYATQAYGPGISVRAKNDTGEVLGLLQLVTRIEGEQYPTILNIPSPNFPEAATIKRKETEEVVESEN